MTRGKFRKVRIYLTYLASGCQNVVAFPGSAGIAAHGGRLNHRRTKAKSPVAAGPLTKRLAVIQTIAEVCSLAQPGLCEKAWAKLISRYNRAPSHFCGDASGQYGRSSRNVSWAIYRPLKTRNITRAILFGDQLALGAQSFSRWSRP